MTSRSAGPTTAARSRRDGALPGLAEAAARSAGWNYAAFAAAKGITLASTVVLARLLAPDEFGLLALGLTITYFLDAVNDFGIGQAVIYLQADGTDRRRRRPDDGHRFADVAFGLNLAVGVALTVVTVGLAPLAARLYGEPAVTAVLMALAPSFLLTSFGSIQDARLRSQLAFRRRLVAEVARAAVKAAVAIALAAAGSGVWALVAGQLAGVTAWSACYWVLDDWRPRWATDARLARDILGYGGRVTVLGLLLIATANVDYLVVGRRLGATALGFYTIAFRLPSLLILQGCKVVSQVVFPAFSRLQGAMADLRDGLLLSIRAVAVATTALGVGLAVAADDVVAVLFGSRWAPAAPVLRVLALYAVVVSLTHNDHDVYKAIGRPGIFNAIMGAQLAAAGPVLWVAAGRSIEAVAWGQLALATAALAVRVAVVWRVLGISPAMLAGALRPAAAVGGMLAAVLVALDAAAQPLPALARLVVLAAAGVATTAVALRWPGRSSVRDLVRLTAPGVAT